MSDTPRTDAVTVLFKEHLSLSTSGEYVAADFARTLERENAALRSELEGVRKDAERWNFVMRHWPYADALWRVVPNEITLTERHLNNAIDAAIAQGKGQDVPVEREE